MLLLIAGRALMSVMVPVTLKLIVSPESVFAAVMASRSEQVVLLQELSAESLVVFTVQVFTAARAAGVNPKLKQAIKPAQKNSRIRTD